MVKNGASSHKTNYIDIFSEILNLEGHLNRCIGSKVTAILLNGWILPTGGASLGKVGTCSQHSRLVSPGERICKSQPGIQNNVCIFSESAPLSPCLRIPCRSVCLSGCLFTKNLVTLRANKSRNLFGQIKIMQPLGPKNLRNQGNKGTLKSTWHSKLIRAL